MEKDLTSPSRQIYLFGALRVYQQGILFPLSGEKSLGLFAFLVLNPRLPHTREKLADLLYTDTSFDRARRNLSDTLYRLQKALGRDWLVITSDAVALRIHEQLWVDAWEFERLVGSDQEDQLQKAIDLYSGDLIPQLYDDWLVAERELRRNQYLTALERLGAQQEKRGELHQALLILRRLVSAEPLHEPAHQSYLRLLGRMQRFGEALAHYDYLRSLMLSELNAEPLAETQLIIKTIERERDLATIQIVVEEQSPFVGRNIERAIILEAVEAMLKGKGSMIAIEGEAGIGKSRLLREIAASLRWRGVSLLQGQASETPGASPFSPLADALAPLFNSARAGQLEALLAGETLAALAPLHPQWHAKAVLFDVPAQQASNRFYAALQSFAEMLTHLAPTALVLDDLQWADPVLWKSLEAFAPALVRGGALLIMVYRRPDIELTPGRDVIENWDRAGYLKTIALEPLTVQDVAQLIGHKKYADPAAIQAWTAGNPFYIHEWLADPDLDRPAPLNTIAQGLRTLSPAARLAVDSASVLGENIPYRLWSEVADLSPVALAGLNDELVAKRWLQPSLSGYAFSHDLIRTAVYNEIGPARRRRLHARSAQAYQTLDPENLRGRAFHLDLAEQYSAAAAAYRQSAEKDMARFAYNEAAASLARALALLPSELTFQRIEIALSLGRVCEVIGDRLRQRPALDEAMQGARSLKDAALLLQVLLVAAQAAISTNQNASAAALLSEAFPLALKLQDRISETEALLLRGMNETHLLHSVAAKKYYAKALKLAQKISDPSREAKALRGLGITARDSGHPHESIKWLEQALVVQRRIGDRLGEVTTRATIIAAYYDLAAWDRVLAISSEVLPRAEELNLNAVSAYVRQVQALAYYSLGDYSTAREIFLQVEQDYRAVDNERGAILAHDSLGLVAENEGDYEQAERYYRTALALIKDIEGASETPIIQNDLGALLVRLERPAEAIPVLQEAFQGWIIEDNELGRLKSEVFLGRGFLANHERARAEELGAGCWQAFQTGIPVGEQPQGWLWALYRLLTDLGQSDSAQVVLQAAYSELQRQAGAIGDADLRRSFFERVPLNRSIVTAYDDLSQAARIVLVQLAHIDAPLGRPLREDEYVRVHWTVNAPEDEAIGNKTERRLYQLKRLLQQAERQNAAPTDEDLARALGVSRRTILRDMQLLSQEFPRPPTRKRKI